MRRALTAAMKARDQPAVTALRSALAAIDNAEAVDTARTTPAAEEPPAAAGETRGGETTGGGIPDRGIAGGKVTGGEVAGAVVGLGASEVERRTLTSAEMEAIVREEVGERQTAARTYERAGQRTRRASAR